MDSEIPDSVRIPFENKSTERTVRIMSYRKTSEIPGVASILKN